jgi:hypothetical protein
MAALTIYTLGHKTPLAMPTPQAADPTNGDTISNNGDTIVLIENTSGTVADTVTVDLAQQVDGQSVTPLSWSIAAASTVVVKLGPPPYYGSIVSLTAGATTTQFTCFRI